MVATNEVSPKKINFVERVTDLLDQYQKFIIFEADNVGAAQMKSIRKQLRGKAEMVMGKNTLFRKAFANQYEKYPSLQRIVSQITGNVGFLFTNEPTLGECRSVLETLSDPKAPKAGAIAQCNVVVPKGVTSISPEKTSFFQSLNISTMINKGCIEIMSDVNLIKAGTKVGESEVTLLAMLNIKPFAYKLCSKIVYDNGDVYSPAVLDITPDDWLNVTKEAIGNIASLALGIGHTTKCSASYSIMDAYKSIIGAYLELGIENDRTRAIQNAMESAASAVTAAPSSNNDAAASKVEEIKEEEEESDDDLGFSLFD